MKRAWFQRIRGGGCQTLVMGEKPMCFHLVLFCHLPLSHPTSSMLCFVSWGSYCWVVVGVAGLSILAHVPTPPADSPLHSRGVEETLSTLPHFYSPPFLHSVYSSSRRNESLVRSHAQDFLGFYPCSFSSTDLQMVWSYTFLTSWFVGSTLLLLMQQAGSCSATIPHDFSCGDPFLRSGTMCQFPYWL